MEKNEDQIVEEPRPRGKGLSLGSIVGIMTIVLFALALLKPITARDRPIVRNTQTLNNAKQISLSMIIYASDYDDRFPLGTVKGPKHWMTGNYAPFPANWCPIYQSYAPYESHWAQAVFPYVKSLGLYSMAPSPEHLGQKPVRATTPLQARCYQQNPAEQRAEVGLTFNGLLQSYPTAAVTDPSRLTLVWQAGGRSNLDGFAYSSPQLNCADRSVPCMFNASGYPQGKDQTIRLFGKSSPGFGHILIWAPFAKDSSSWVYGKGIIFSSTDTSTRHVTINAPASSVAAHASVMKFGVVNNKNPFTRTDSDSSPGTPYYTSACDEHVTGKAPGPRNIVYDCFFRPDSDFKYSNANANDY